MQYQAGKWLAALSAVGVLSVWAHAGECESAWSAFDASVNEAVTASIVVDDGSGPALYIGGWFTAGGGEWLDRIARWDGETWLPLGSGIGSLSQDRVDDLIVFDDGNGPALYAAGQFSVAGGVAANNIAKWDGKNWSPLGVGTNGRIRTLAVFDDGSGEALYAAGYFGTAGGSVARRVARWNGTSWSNVGGTSSTSGNVHRLLVADLGDGPALYAGGSFTSIVGVSAQRFARWNGSSWSSLGAVNGEVNALATYDDGDGLALYLGGLFTSAGGVSAMGLAAYDGATFSAAGAFDDRILELQVHDDGEGPALYVAGQFTQGGDDQSVQRIVRYDGESWSPLDSGANNSIHTLASWPQANALVAGGNFSQAGGQSVGRIAMWRSQSMPITILEHPDDVHAEAGEVVTFTVDAVSEEQLTYQWRRNGVVLDGETESVLIFDPVSESDSGLYDVLIGNDCEEELSEAAELTVKSEGVVGDLNGDGVVDVSDLLILLGAWGECQPKSDCPADLNNDGVVDVSDLLVLLAAWG